MEEFTAEIIEFYIENKRAIVLTQRAYTRYFEVRKPPYKRTILSLFQPHSSHRTIFNVYVEALKKSLQGQLQGGSSIWRSRTSLQWIQGTLQMYPYKMQLVQELKLADCRISLCYLDPRIGKTRSRFHSQFHNKRRRSIFT